MVEQGLSFTLLQTPHPMDDPGHVTRDVRGDFYEARRVWLGSTGGVDWLHDAIESEFGEDAVWYDVESRRNATHIGASGEVAYVLLVLMGAGALDFIRNFNAGFAQRLGELSADSFIEWVRRVTRDRRKAEGMESWDGPPNFYDQEVDELARSATGELAGLVHAPEERFELVSATRPEGLA
ncbi:MAG: hypothetical protein M3320_01150, partial [Actinomycetota bacterium]|nr:hypothetical protein [Actinomycetota bacterium]